MTRRIRVGRSASPTGVRPFASSLGEDEAVDVVARPGAVADRGRRRVGQGLPGPVLLAELRRTSRRACRPGDGRPPRARRRRPRSSGRGRRPARRSASSSAASWRRRRRGGRPGAGGSRRACRGRPPGRRCRPGAGRCGRRPAGRPWRWCWRSGSCSSCRPAAAGPSSRRTRRPPGRRAGRRPPRPRRRRARARGRSSDRTDDHGSGPRDRVDGRVAAGRWRVSRPGRLSNESAEMTSPWPVEPRPRASGG